MMMVVHNSASVFATTQPESQAGGSPLVAVQGSASAEQGDHRRGPILFFDGVCGICNRTVDFVLTRDKQGTFRFAPLQGETARRYLDPRDVASLDTIVLVDEAGTHRRSSAVVRILLQLPGIWRFCGFLLWLIPRPLRDLGYRWIAAHRYRWFGKHETCRLPQPQEQTRFLP